MSHGIEQAWAAEGLLNVTYHHGGRLGDYGSDTSGNAMKNASESGGSGSVGDGNSAYPMITSTSTAAPVHERTDDGFRSIELFVGAKRLRQVAAGSHEPSGYRSDKDSPGTWHGQVGQDRTVHRLFGGRRGGYFVDLASNEPVYFSNSRTLERDHGWRGVCIDGSLELAAKTVASRTCRVVQAIVTGRSGDTVRFRTSSGQHESGYGGIVNAEGSEGKEQASSREGGGGNGGGASAIGASAGAGVGAVAIGLSGTNPAHFGAKKDRPSAAWQMAAQETTVTLADILRHVGAPQVIDYLSLDVEGAEENILLAFLRGSGDQVAASSPTLRAKASATTGTSTGTGIVPGTNGASSPLSAPSAPYIFRVMTVERPTRPTRDALRRSGYQYIGDHGCFGDQLWVHRSFTPEAERRLGLKLIEDADSGNEAWFANCSARASWTLQHKLRAWPFSKGR